MNFVHHFEITKKVEFIRVQSNDYLEEDKKFVKSIIEILLKNI